MPMTPDELVRLDKLLCRLDRNARAWSVTRWIITVFGLVFVGLGMWHFMMLPKGWHDLIPQVDGIVDTYSLMSANEAVLNYCLLWAMSVINAVLGGFLMASALCRWRKGHQDGLLLKMARSWLESQVPAVPSCRDTLTTD